MPAVGIRLPWLRSAREERERETREALRWETREALEREALEELEALTGEALERLTPEALERLKRERLRRETREASPSSRVKIHLPPAFRLRAHAEFLFSPNTYSRVFQPTIRDLREEYYEALGEQRLWKARYVRLRGYCAFWSAVWAQCSGSIVKKLLQAFGVATSSS